MTRYTHSSRAWLEDAGGEASECGLSGSVGAEDSADRSGLYRERSTGEGGCSGAVAVADVAKLEETHDARRTASRNRRTPSAVRPRRSRNWPTLEAESPGMPRRSEHAARSMNRQRAPS